MICKLLTSNIPLILYLALFNIANNPTQLKPNHQLQRSFYQKKMHLKHLKIRMNLIKKKLLMILTKRTNFNFITKTMKILRGAWTGGSTLSQM